MGSSPISSEVVGRETADLVSFTEEILNEKLHFLRSIYDTWISERIYLIFYIFQSRLFRPEDEVSTYFLF